MKKKRILCGLLTLAMLMALLTVTAFAEDAALTLPPEGGELASGTYQLSEDLTISNPLEIPKNSDITIDLNGHTLNTPAANWGVLVYGTCTVSLHFLITFHVSSNVVICCGCNTEPQNVWIPLERRNA